MLPSSINDQYNALKKYQASGKIGIVCKARFVRQTYCSNLGAVSWVQNWPS